jgi:hypothetical protein
LAVARGLLDVSSWRQSGKIVELIALSIELHEVIALDLA